ncbi:4752_t:CDS:2 [Dentiscutata heterogama]|uniref:4752_t:CDS:1 n=1 Tax=Dentiscutata heterogama TaxID=1316150 RepID=A0ACA9KUZ1_9GLOM|nr:4752_t:CDS:2 [Dentiscutata heterogama]
MWEVRICICSSYSFKCSFVSIGVELSSRSVYALVEVVENPLSISGASAKL